MSARTANFVFVIVVVLNFLIGYLIGSKHGYLVGREKIRAIEDSGYSIVTHTVRHGDYYTNWVEVVKGEAK